MKTGHLAFVGEQVSRTMLSSEQGTAVNLRRIEPSWDFRGAPTKYATHGIYHYPAMMVAPVVKRLIEDIIGGSKEKTLLDPFCGSGSALVEAAIHGMPAVGIDTNPLAVLLARVKTTPVAISDIQDEFHAIRERYDNMPETPPNTSLHNYGFWYSESVARSLTRLGKTLATISDTSLRRFFQLCLAETARYVSWTRQSEFKVYRIPEEKRRLWHPRVLEVFDDVVSRNTKCMSEFLRLLPSGHPDVNVIDGDSRNPSVLAKKKYDVVVTSPPYGDSQTTVAYGQYSRLSLAWLGYDLNTINQIDRVSLGGRIETVSHGSVESPTLKRQLEEIKVKDAERARHVFAFYNDLARSFRNVSSHLSSGGTACVVVGNRTVKGVCLNTDVILSEILTNECGLEHVDTLVRNIPNKSMPSKNSPTNIVGTTGKTMTNEYILVLKKP